MDAYWQDEAILASLRDEEADNVDALASAIADGEPLYDPYLYVNVYDVVRCYGGPEEGGWWYDAGSVIHSVKMRSESAARAYVRVLRTLYAPQMQDAHNGGMGRYSVTGGSDVVVTVGDAPAEPFPAEVPYYC